MDIFLQQLANGLILGSIYALIAVGLSQIFGVIRVLQWAHGEVYMIGAYIGFILTTNMGIPYFLTLVIVMFIMGLFGLLIDKLFFLPLRKSSRINTTLGAIGLSIFLLNISILVFSSRPRSFIVSYLNVSINMGPVTLTTQRLAVFTVSLLLIISLSIFMKKSIYGKAMLAISQDMVAASLMGIDVNKMSSMAFIIGSALAGAAGVLVSPVFSLYPQMSAIVVAKAFAVVILGGMGYIEGAIVAGFILGLAESLTAAYISSAYKDVVAFILLILILYFKPEGIFGKSTIEKV